MYYVGLRQLVFTEAGSEFRIDPESLKVSEVTKYLGWKNSLGDEPEGVGLAEIGVFFNDWLGGSPCGGKPHKERHAKVSEAEAQLCPNMWVNAFLDNQYETDSTC